MLLPSISALQGEGDQQEDPDLFENMVSSPQPYDASQSDDLGIESMVDDLEFDFDAASYREAACTPSSSFSLSPAASSSCLYSPSVSCTYEASLSSGVIGGGNGSPPGTAMDLHEFLQATAKCEKDLGNLTLTDHEQRELYEAAQIIQKAFRSYKGRKRAALTRRLSSSFHQQHQASLRHQYLEGDSQSSSILDREVKAAMVIQNCYRRYKQVRSGQ